MGRRVLITGLWAIAAVTLVPLALASTALGPNAMSADSIREFGNAPAGAEPVPFHLPNSDEHPGRTSFLGRAGALVWALLGAFFSLVLYLLHEWLRRPDLVPEVLSPSDQPGGEREYEGRPAKRGRWVNIRITNRPLTGWRRYVLVGGRRSALFCRGLWLVTPESGPDFAVPVHWSLDDPTLAVYPALNRLAGTTFLHGDTSEVCNLAAQFDDESDCYVWSADSLGPLAKWRKPEWRLPPGQHGVRLDLIYEAGRQRFNFVIRNGGQRSQLRVERVT